MRIYNLDNGLTEEQKAVVFAKTSRSPLTFEEIAKDVTEQSSAEFHEKWVVGYGHQSVSEHAILHVAVEDVSMLAAKAIEDCRLGSYTEKSTRYQIYDEDSFYTPPELDDHPIVRQQYQEHMSDLITTYREWHDDLTMILAEEEPNGKFLRQVACDQLRDMLPVATTTNLGLTMNARSLAHTIRKLKSSRNAELLNIGTLLETTGKVHVPTLLKYCDPADTEDRNYKQIWDIAALPLQIFKPHCIVTHVQIPSSLNRVKLRDIDGLSFTRDSRRIPGPHEKLDRTYEMITIHGQMSLDFGAWRDIQRHRMATMIPSVVSPEHITIPRGVSKLGRVKPFLRLAYRSKRLAGLLYTINQPLVSYPSMMACGTVVSFTMNMREAHYFCRLRADKKAHENCRIIAKSLWNSICNNVAHAEEIMPAFLEEE